MELRYNLTREDYFRGLRLHERRITGIWAALRLVFSLAALASAALSGVTVIMMAVIALTGNWSGELDEVAAPFTTILAVSLLLLYLLSPGWRARVRLRRDASAEGFFGPHTLRLESGGAALSFGGCAAVAPYGSLTQVWEKKGCCLLYDKNGLWCVLPPCAFESGEQRAAFVERLRAAMAGDRPPEEGGAERPLPPADFRFDYAWTREELREAVTRANLEYAHTKLFWRPFRVVLTALGGVILLMGVLSLVGAALALPDEGPGGLAYGLSLVLLGLGLVSNLAVFLPPAVRAMVSRQIKQGKLDDHLGGGQTGLFWAEGLVSLSGGGREEVRWGQIAQVHSGDGGLYLFRRDSKLHVFPSHAFRDRQEQARAAEYVREHIKSAG